MDNRIILVRVGKEWEWDKEWDWEKEREWEHKRAVGEGLGEMSGRNEWE